jgi:hypothetical protein
MTLGQKGRAGYGASLDGMVKLLFRACFFFFFFAETAPVAL